MRFLAKAEPKKLRIKLARSIAGQRVVEDPKTGKLESMGSFFHAVGAVIDWQEDEAKRFIEAGYAISAEGKELQLGTMV
jgi:hypothetical protein